MNGDYLGKKDVLEYHFLIPILEEKSLTYEEIKNKLIKNGINPVRTKSCIEWLTVHTPLYQPSGNSYKILTRKDTEDYEEKHRRKIIYE